MRIHMAIHTVMYSIIYSMRMLVAPHLWVTEDAHDWSASATGMVHCRWVGQT